MDLKAFLKKSLRNSYLDQLTRNVYRLKKETKIKKSPNKVNRASKSKVWEMAQSGLKLDSSYI